MRLQLPKDNDRRGEGEGLKLRSSSCSSGYGGSLEMSRRYSRDTKRHAAASFPVLGAVRSMALVRVPRKSPHSRLASMGNSTLSSAASFGIDERPCQSRTRRAEVQVITSTISTGRGAEVQAFTAMSSLSSRCRERSAARKWPYAKGPA